MPSLWQEGRTGLGALHEERARIQPEKQGEHEPCRSTDSMVQEAKANKDGLVPLTECPRAIDPRRQEMEGTQVLEARECSAGKGIVIFRN